MSRGERVGFGGGVFPTFFTALPLPAAAFAALPGNHGTMRETAAWYSLYAGYLLEASVSVTSIDARGGTKRTVRKSGPAIVQFTQPPRAPGVPAATEKR